MESRRAVVNESLDGSRLDLACCEIFSDLSRKRIKSIIDQGGAYRNRKRVARANETVRAGDVIEIYWREGGIRSRPKLSPEDLIFEDEDFLVISKPAGLPTQATLESAEGTVLEALEQDFKSSHPELVGPFLLVHRLDKDTSGLLIVARNGDSKTAFDEQFKKHMVQKTYLAIVAGKPSSPKGTVSGAIAKDSLAPNRYRMVPESRPHVGGARPSKKPIQAKEALTDYELIAFSDSSLSSLMRFRPKTGRTHQIRVHASQGLGCPLLGDKTYGRQILGHPVHLRALRHMLHAFTLKFPHPRTGEWVSFQAPLPDDLKSCLGECGLTFEES